MADVLRQLVELVQTLPKNLLEITDSIYLYGSMARGDVSKDRTLSLYFPTASSSLFCLLNLVPHCPSLWLCKRTWNQGDKSKL